MKFRGEGVPSWYQLPGEQEIRFYVMRPVMMVTRKVLETDAGITITHKEGTLSSYSMNGSTNRLSQYQSPSQTPCLEVTVQEMSKKDIKVWNALERSQNVSAMEILTGFHLLNMYVLCPIMSTSFSLTLFIANNIERI